MAGVIRSIGAGIVEISGALADAGVVLGAACSDSRDLGMGAVDDAEGIAIMAAAAKRTVDTRRSLALGNPARLILPPGSG